MEDGGWRIEDGGLRIRGGCSSIAERRFSLSILYPPSSILNPLSSILYPQSSILYPPSSMLTSLVAQRNDRIDSRCPARRDQTGDQGHHNEHQRHSGEDNRISWADLKQQTRDCSR